MKQKQANTKQKGFVIIVVLAVVMMLMVLLLGFNYKSRLSLRAADDFKKSKLAINCARTGLNIAIAAIKSSDNIFANRDLFALFSPQRSFSLDDGSCSVTITDENGKLNVNLLIDKNNAPESSGIDSLLRLIDLLNQKQTDRSHIPYSIVPSIVDWIDSDDQVAHLPFIKNDNSGAESDYYLKLTAPYKCANAPLKTTEELLLVKDLAPDVFQNISGYLTVYGDGKININSAPKLVIESLSENLDCALAQMIIDRRQIEPFDSVAELQDVPGLADSIFSEIRSKLTVAPQDACYQVASTGNVDRISRTIVAILKKNTTSKSIEVLLYKEL